MGQRQPVGQMCGRFIRRGAVKRHHGCCLPAGHQPKLRPPSVADGPYFDLVRAPANRLVEAMNVHVGLSERMYRGSNETATILRACDVQSSERITKTASTVARSRVARRIRLKKNLHPKDLHKICTDGPQLFHNARLRTLQAAPRSRMPTSPSMTSVRLCVGVLVCLAVTVQPAAPAADPALSDVALFRIFLLDGSSVVSYGEYARVDGEVVFAMPLGTSLKDPRLQVITLPAAAVDWLRTDRYALSTRYQRYVATQAETDFAVMSAEVAAILNQIALTTEPERALKIADEARRTLAEWPSRHFGYRQHDISDIVSLIDDAVSGLAGARESGSVQLSFVNLVPTIPIEPVLGMMSPRDQVARLVRLADMLPRAADREAVLRAALSILDDPASGITADDIAAVRRSLESQLRNETSINDRYAKLAKRLTGDARRAAASASVAGVERVLGTVAAEDAKLGRKRPESVSALIAELDAQLEAARDLRLRRDQWELRRDLYREYVNRVSAQVSQLVRAQASLEAIRRLAGPSPARLLALKETLEGGADRLQRLGAPAQLQLAHDLLVNAWRFAEGAAVTRHTAVISGDLATARQASSAAAGSLLLLARAQAEMRSALEPPRPR